MKIDTKKRTTQIKIRFPVFSEKSQCILRNPWVLSGLLLGIVFVSMLAGVYMYKAGYFTRIKAVLKEARFDTQESIQKELSPYVENGLPDLYLDIAFDDFQKISQKRDEALQAGILFSTDEDYVPAKIRLENEAPQFIELRLKGDWTDHIAGDKWSFRIHVKKGGQLFGMRNFSIQAPETREFLDEWAYHQYLLDQDIMTTHYHFVNVILNGEPKGIYAVEESFAEELIESEKRRQGVLLRFNEDEMWQNTLNFWQENITIGGGLWVTDLSTAQVSLFREGTIMADETLSTQARAAVALLEGYQSGHFSASQVFDVALMGKFFAVSDLWAAMHGTAWHNIRFYYNPITALLEPVVYDGEAFRPQDDQNTLALSFADDRLFSDPNIRIAYAQAIQELTKVEKLDAFIEATRPDFEIYQTALENEYFRDGERELLESPWASLKRRAEMLQLQFQPETPVRGTIRPVWLDNELRSGSFLEVTLQNQFLIPINLLSVWINGREYPITNTMQDQDSHLAFNLTIKDQTQLLPIRDWNLPTPRTGRIYIPFDLDFYDVLTSQPAITVQIAGTDIVKKSELTNQEMVDQPLSPFRPAIPELETVLITHSFLRISEKYENALEILPGNWVVSSDLVLPQDTNLVAGPGTILNFHEDAVLYTTGALLLEGTKKDPVIFQAQDDYWPGLIVIRSNEESVLNHVVISNTSSIQRGGWFLTGGITFFESRVVLNFVTIDGTIAEDSINVIRSTFSFSNSIFQDTASDAFDSDFSNGIVSDCEFINIGGDGVDISGSQTEVKNSVFQMITDKAISVGENSSMLIQDVSIQGTGIGVASKDLSTAELLRVRISGAKNAAIAAYQKKPVFGPAKLYGEEVIIIDCDRISIIQYGSVGNINGIELETVKQTFDDLFLQGLLGS
jgi:hypothetical protein